MASTRILLIKRVNILILIAAVILLAYFGYFGSKRVSDEAARYVLATGFGGLYLVFMLTGPFIIYLGTYLQGVRLSGRILAACLIPFLWMTKDVMALTESHPFIECLYWYFNPLHIWMVCLVALQIGLAELIGRAIYKRHGVEVKIFSIGPFVVILTALIVSIGIFAWGQGENIFSLYLDGYRLLFGYGG